MGGNKATDFADEALGPHSGYHRQPLKRVRRRCGVYNRAKHETEGPSWREEQTSWSWARGVAGCASAYFLARDGAKVTVVERDAIGSGASGYALGALNPMAGSYISGRPDP